MKKEILKQLIKEEIRKVIKEEINQDVAKKEASEVLKLKKYLEGPGKMALKQVNKKEEVKDLLNAIYNGMNDTMKKNSMVNKVFSRVNKL